MLPASLDLPRTHCRRRGKRRRSNTRIGAEFVASCSSAQRIRKLGCTMAELPRDCVGRNDARLCRGLLHKRQHHIRS